MRFSWVLVPLLAVTCAATTASAGGFDTPILYSARHLGMGGTAVSYVDDASAAFHNPAGFGRIGKANVLVNVSPIIGSLQSSPEDDPNLGGAPVNLSSETTFAPFFLVGGAVRVWDYLTVGVTAFPVASAGAEYKYQIGDEQVRDYTKLVFLEIAPSVGFNYEPWGLYLGASWRINTVSLDREKTWPLPIDIGLKGTGLKGFRFGAQWDVPWIEGLSLGLHYRTKVEMRAELTDRDNILLAIPVAEGYQDWTLPSRLSFGASHKVGPMRVAFDAEYAFQSQNVRSDVIATEPEGVRLTNVFAWTNAWTLRGGVEYGVYEDRIPIRVGFIWDQRSSNPSYPSAFGTPPASTYTLTAGTGYRYNKHRVNFAAAYRTGRRDVGQEHIDARVGSELGTCASCGEAGLYKIKMIGIYLDYSYDF
jgi:long-subunit fatty acid transport protein